MNNSPTDIFSLTIQLPLSRHTVFKSLEISYQPRLRPFTEQYLDTRTQPTLGRLFKSHPRVRKNLRHRHQNDSEKNRTTLSTLLVQVPIPIHRHSAKVTLSQEPIVQIARHGRRKIGQRASVCAVSDRWRRAAGRACSGKVAVAASAVEPRAVWLRCIFEAAAAASSPSPQGTASHRRRRRAPPVTHTHRHPRAARKNGKTSARTDEPPLPTGRKALRGGGCFFARGRGKIEARARAHTLGDVLFPGTCALGDAAAAATAAAADGVACFLVAPGVCWCG